MSIFNNLHIVHSNVDELLLRDRELVFPTEVWSKYGTIAPVSLQDANAIPCSSVFLN